MMSPFLNYLDLEKKKYKTWNFIWDFFFTLCNFEAETCNSLQKVGIEARLAPGHMVLVWYWGVVLDSGERNVSWSMWANQLKMGLKPRPSDQTQLLYSLMSEERRPKECFYICVTVWRWIMKMWCGLCWLLLGPWSSPGPEWFCPLL